MDALVCIDRNIEYNADKDLDDEAKVAFVIDLKYRKSPDLFKSVKRGIENAIKQLSSSSSYNIIAVSGTKDVKSKQCWDGFMEANEDNYSEAKNFLKSIKLDICNSKDAANNKENHHLGTVSYSMIA